MAVEILKESDPEKIRIWDLLHDKRKTYRCNRCGCEWKCEWKDNKFGDRQEFNGDPDILCQKCGSNAVEELEVTLESPIDTDRKCKYANECFVYKPIDTD